MGEDGMTARETNYSRLVNNPDARRKFIEHVIGFIEKHDFDGLDLDWEYPAVGRLSAKRKDTKTRMPSLPGSENCLLHLNQRVFSCLLLSVLAKLSWMWAMTYHRFLHT